jgi:hypothetical protein
MDDVVNFMIARSTPDVATTIGWLGENNFEVTQQSGGAGETFGNAQVEFNRGGLAVRITKDRSEWKLDVSPPGIKFMNLQYLIDAKEKAGTGDTAEGAATPSAVTVEWHATLPGVIAWVEEEDRTEILNSASDAWRVASRQYWSTLGSESKPPAPT